MKLITELNENVKTIIEGKGDDKKLYIEGVFLQSSIKNRNGRVYPEHVMDKEVARYVKENISRNRAVGELGHPEGPQINLDRISHRIISLKKEGTNYVGKALITSTPMGNIAKGLIESGVSLGVSSRGMGTLKVNSQGVNEVQSDFKLATAADIVGDPSAPDAWVNGIMENTEWIFDEKNGWISLNIAEAVQRERKLRKIKEDKLTKLFSTFMENVARS